MAFQVRLNHPRVTPTCGPPACSGMTNHARHPGGNGRRPRSLLFWGSVAVALLIAGAAAFPVNRWLIARGYRHALVQHHH